MSIPLADTPTVGLGQFIRESRFVVPTHQRDYSWTDEVDVFLRDIEEAKKDTKNIYFCGLMVFTAVNTPLLKVLDGQQRLATTLMLFSAIRNWLFKNPDFREDATKISTQLLTRDDIGSKPEPKLSLTPANNVAFQKFVIESSHISEIEKAHKKADKQDRDKKLLMAALSINRHVEKKAAEFDTPKAARDYFVDLIGYIGSTVKVVRFVLSGDDAAYTIFETLNDRGLELAPLDLVKNFLFSRAERYQDGALAEFEERWSQMMALLGSEAADSFLKAFWTSRHGALEGPKLFGKFKEQYGTPQAAHEISIDLRRGAENYAAIFLPTDAVWKEYTFQARQRVSGLGIIGASQLYPIILAALEKFQRQEMERLLCLLEAVAVRYQLINRGRPGRIESLGGRAARDIWNNKITRASEVKAALAEIYVPDDDFKRQFSIHSEKNGKKARYILTTLERQSLLNEGQTYQNELVPGDITLEHVFPKSPKEHWASELQGDAKLAQMKNRLGNLCLLTDVNRALGNKGWADKLEVFRRSRLRMTSTISKEQFQKWGSAEIEKRQVHMAELASAVWRYE